MKVVELSGGLSAGFAGMLLARMGHEVLRAVDLGGRPFAAHGTEPLSQTASAYLHSGKELIPVDPSSSSGRHEILRLSSSSSVLIEDLGSGVMEASGLTAAEFRKANDTLTIVRISPFGQCGPRATWASSELVLQAMGGVVHSTGFEGEAPLRAGGTPAHFIAGIHAATAALAGASGARLGSAEAPVVDIAIEEVYLHHWARHIAGWAYSGHGMQRERRKVGRQGFPHTVKANDGWLYLLALHAEWEPLAAFLGLEHFVTHKWSDPMYRAEHWEEIAPHFYHSILSRSRYDWFADAAETGYTFAPIQDVADLAASPQHEARSFLKRAEVNGQEVACPGLPFTWMSVDTGHSERHMV